MTGRWQEGWRGEERGTYPKSPMNPTASTNTPIIGYLKNTRALVRTQTY